jgi:hypothetical protein
MPGGAGANENASIFPSSHKGSTNAPDSQLVCGIAGFPSSACPGQTRYSSDCMAASQPQGLYGLRCLERGRTLD